MSGVELAGGWQRKEIQEVLEDRLGDTRDTYLAVLQDLDATSARLAKATFVDDLKFQAKLQNDSQQENNAHMIATGLIGRQSIKGLFENKSGGKDAKSSVSSELTQVTLTASAFAFASGLSAEPMSSLLPNARDLGLCTLAYQTTIGTAALAILSDATSAQSYELHRVLENEPLRSNRSLSLTSLL
ncbi:hypothetical protein BST61_g11506 [Cercospora zeina]